MWAKWPAQMSCLLLLPTLLGNVCHSPWSILNGSIQSVARPHLSLSARPAGLHLLLLLGICQIEFKSVKSPYMTVASLPSPSHSLPLSSSSLLLFSCPEPALLRFSSPKLCGGLEVILIECDLYFVLPTCFGFLNIIYLMCVSRIYFNFP